LDNILINQGNSFLNIKLEDVYFFSCNKGRILIYLDNNVVLKISRQSLDYIESIVNDNFFRSHRSYLINIKKVDTITKFSTKSYNISFKNIKSEAYMTQKRFNLLYQKIHI